MTHDPIEQLTSDVRSMQLTNEERSLMRRTLIGTIHMHPVRPRWAAFIARHAIGYLFASLILLMGGTTVLAQRSLPGDPLYLLKTKVTERVSVVVAGNEDARIQKELDQIDRALNEEDVVAEQEFTLEIEASSDSERESPNESASLRMDESIESDLNDLEQELVEVDTEAAIEFSM